MRKLLLRLHNTQSRSNFRIEKRRNSAFHSGGFGGAELLKQRFSQLRFWKSFKLRTGRLLDCPVFSKVQKGKVLFYRQDACGQKLQALERHGY